MRSLVILALIGCGDNFELVDNAHVLVDGFDSTEHDCRTDLRPQREHRPDRP